MGLLRKEDMHESFWKEGVSNPNLLINGDFQIWQRGTSFNFTDGINYSADRWNNNYQIASYSRVINTSQAPCKYAMRVVNNATNNEGYAILKQPFEEILTNSIKGKEITLSFYVRGQSSVRLNATIGENISLDYPEFNIELTSEWKRVSHVLCSNECDNLTIQLRGIDGSSKDDWFEVTGVKLELGSVATQFVPRQIGEELALCQRYYEKITYTERLICSLESKQVYEFTIPFKVEKRTKPSQRVIKVSNEDIDITNIVEFFNSGVSNFGAFVRANDNPNAFKIGNRISIDGIADAEIY